MPSPKESKEAFVRAMRTDVATIVEEQKKIPEQPVIHRNISDMSTVLNRFVYQKGGWVLHMLRGLIGTDAFWTGIREYYRRYRNANASTDDLRQVMEQVSGQDLTWFFDQWLRRPGLVKLSGVWRYDASARQIVVELAQVQLGEPYRIPLEVGVVETAGKMRTERVELTGAKGRFTIAAEAAPSSVLLDPNTWVLMEAPEFVRKQAASVSPRADKGHPAGGR
jgi:aminopeptidase N